MPAHPIRVILRVLAATVLWTVEMNAFSQEGVKVETPGFDLEKLSKPPAFIAADGLTEEGVHGIFYDGIPYRGKPTKVFAYYGLPSNELVSEEQTSEAPRKCPGVVLIHGGGGTAFAEWVRLWNRRGYAAIAMDV